MSWEEVLPSDMEGQDEQAWIGEILTMMKQHPRLLRFLLEKLEGSNQKEIAESLGVDTRTLRRWAIEVKEMLRNYR